MLDLGKITEQLESRKKEVLIRLERITRNVTSRLEADSEEQVVVRENQEVLDDLGNMARTELEQINSALNRIESGDYGICIDCGVDIPEPRLIANPFALRCVGCEEKREQQ